MSRRTQPSRPPEAAAGLTLPEHDVQHDRRHDRQDDAGRQRHVNRDVGAAKREVAREVETAEKHQGAAKEHQDHAEYDDNSTEIGHLHI